MWSLEQLHLMSMRQAAGLMAQRGYGQVRAEEVAKAGGLSVGSFYRRYGSKQGFAQQVRQFAEREVCHLARMGFERGMRPPEGHFRQAFDAFFRELAWCAQTKPEFFCFAFLHWHPDSLEPRAPGGQTRALVRERGYHGSSHSEGLSAHALLDAPPRPRHRRTAPGSVPSPTASSLSRAACAPTPAPPRPVLYGASPPPPPARARGGWRTPDRRSPRAAPRRCGATHAAAVLPCAG